LVFDAILPPKFAPEDRWMLEIAPQTHALDEQVKEVLRKDGICVPETVNFNGYDISIMRDFGANGFTLLSTQLNERNVYLSEAICAAIGQSLARVMNVLSTNTSLQPVEDTHRQFAQRI